MYFTLSVCTEEIERGTVHVREEDVSTNVSFIVGKITIVFL